MKTSKKILAVVLTVVMILSLSVCAFADGTGKITITNAEIGRTYKLFKLLDQTASGENRAYYVDSTSPLYAELTSDAGKAIFTVGEEDADGKCAVSFEAENKEAAEAFLVAAADKLSALKTATLETGNEIVWDGLDLGYYLVDTANADVIITVDVDSAVEIVDKTLDKPDTEEGFKAAEDTFVGVGETAEFTVTFTATNFVTEQDEEGEYTSKQIKEYQVVDTPANLKILKSQDDPITVTVDGAALGETAYTAELKDGVLTVSIPWMAEGKAIYASDAEVIVAYSALVTDLDASNKAEISYTFAGEDEPEEPFTPEEEGEVEIENGSITINANVPGGTYELRDASGNKIDLVEVEEGVFRPFVEGEDKAKYTGTLDGDDVIKGLGEGDYTVAELSAPDGYNPAGDVDVTISDDDADVEAAFEYQAGAVLPTTGSFGTTMLLALGSVLFVCTAVVLVAKKRLYNEGV